PSPSRRFAPGPSLSRNGRRGGALRMFARFFLELRQAKVPVSLREYLMLLEAMKQNLAAYSVDEVYYLSRAALVKGLAQQQGRHERGSKWLGTAGTSPYGAYGYNPEGVRIGQNENRNNRAV